MGKITILGDVMFQKQMLGCNYDGMFLGVKGYLSEADLVMANLETPIEETTRPDEIKDCQFVASVAYARALKNANIKVVSTANNHCLDNGKEGVCRTINALDEVGMEHVGTYKSKNEKRYLIKNVDGRKVAIVANTYGTNAFVGGVYLDKNDDFYICMLQEQELKNGLARKIYFGKTVVSKGVRKILKTLRLFQFSKQAYERAEKSLLKQIEADVDELKSRELPDYIVMMTHDGGQNNDLPIARTEERIKEIKKMGIDAIIANHEHMIHRVEAPDERVVTYSLGNFMSLSGVLVEPFDKMQDYSIGINIYFEKNEVRYTFVIFKLAFNKQKQCVQVNLLHDLIEQEKDAQKRSELINDNGIIVKKVLGKLPTEVKREYDI